MPQTAVANQMTIGLAGQLSTLHSAADAKVGTAFSQEASAGIDVGLFVKHGTVQDGVLLPSAVTDKLRGIVVHSHSFARDIELDASGFLKPGVHFSVVETGAITVVAKQTAVPGDTVRVQVVAEAGFLVGDLRRTASVAKTIDISALARWKTTAAAIGDLAVVEIDMTNIALAVAD